MSGGYYKLSIPGGAVEVRDYRVPDTSLPGMLVSRVFLMQDGTLRPIEDLTTVWANPDGWQMVDSWPVAEFQKLQDEEAALWAERTPGTV